MSHADQDAAIVRPGSGAPGKAAEASGAHSVSATGEATLVDLVSAGVDGKPAAAPHAPSPEGSRIPQAGSGHEEEGVACKMSAPSSGDGEETGAESDDDMTCEDAERLLRQALGAAIQPSSTAETSSRDASPSTIGGSTASTSLPCEAKPLTPAKQDSSTSVAARAASAGAEAPTPFPAAARSPTPPAPPATKRSLTPQAPSAAECKSLSPCPPVAAAESAPQNTSANSGGTEPASAEQIQPSASEAASTGAALSSAPVNTSLTHRSLLRRSVSKSPVPEKSPGDDAACSTLDNGDAQAVRMLKHQDTTNPKAGEEEKEGESLLTVNEGNM